MSRLKGKSFVIRPLRMSDAQSIARHANDPEIARNTLRIPFPYTLRDAKQWLTKQKQDAKTGSPQYRIFGIEIDGKIVGAIGLHSIVNGHKAELGYWLGRPFWRRGIMTEAVALVISYAFKTMKLRRLYAFTFLWNRGSQRVLEKSGFVREGTLQKSVRKGKRLLDNHLYALVK